jgi:hypothetical protein
MTLLEKKIKDIVAYITTGFTIAHGILFVIIAVNSNLYNTILYHYSDSLIWYLIFYVFPFLAGVIFCLVLIKKNVLKGFKVVCLFILILQISFSIIATNLNSKYWGYLLKRPTVFSEVKEANTILNCSQITNYDSVGIMPLYITNNPIMNMENVLRREDPYSCLIGRLFMIFQDHASQQGDLYDFERIYNDQQKNITKTALKDINNQIRSLNFIDKTDSKSKYYDHSGKLSGILTEFSTINNKKYIFAGLAGKEISNDHYPFYEFLFIDHENSYKLIKYQKFYTDIAGIEGQEYGYIAPLFSLLLTMLGLFVSVIIALIYFLFNLYKRHHSITDISSQSTR